MKIFVRRPPVSLRSSWSLCFNRGVAGSISKQLGDPAAVEGVRLRSSGGRSGEKGEEVPVLIVGAGPVGLTLSILLSKYGVPSLLVERRARLSNHPQAHFLNNRTMEIFRKLDGLAGEIEAKQPPVEHWRRFVYCTTLAGPVLGTVDHLQPQDLTSERSPTSVAHFSQNHLLPLLYKRAQELGHKLQIERQCLKHSGLNPTSAPILMGHECLSIRSSSDGVIARISPQGDEGMATDLACQYLAAADGAGSLVRRLTGVRMEGHEEMQNLISVHFLSKQLGWQLLATPEPGMLYFVFNPAVIAVVVAHNLEAGEFVAQIPFYPPQQRTEDFTTEVCRSLIWDVAGRRDIAVEVKTVKPWVMHAQVADRYFDRSKRVILAGDAAHRFPPAGGFGLNTGIQDAHNLAWKLAAVLSGHASRALLLSYETERRPVDLHGRWLELIEWMHLGQIGGANTALSVANFEAAMAIPAALGLDPSVARLVHRAVNSGVGSFLPESIQSALLDGVFAIGRAQVSPAFFSNFNPIGSARLAEVQRILKEGHSLQLQFPAEDLGFRYAKGALVPEHGDAGTDKPETAPTGRRQEYLPSTQPGSRLPHFPIRIHGPKFAPSCKGIESTLDLVSGDIVQFVLIVGSCKSGCIWADAALSAGKSYGVSMKVVFIWPAGSCTDIDRDDRIDMRHSPSVGRSKEETEAAYVNNWCFKNEGKFVHAEEVGSGWWEMCDIPEVGAILVRPDEHIAWRSTTEAHSYSAHELGKVLARVLAKSCSNRPEIQA